MKKFCLIMVFVFMASMITVANSEETVERILYISSKGNNSNSGTSETVPLKSLAWAYGKLGKNTKIILLDDTEYYEPEVSYNEDVVIEGKTNSVKLILPSTTNVKGNLKIDNVILSGTSIVHANGYRLEIGENVTSDARLKIYGGGTTECASTDLRLYGGQYSTIYAGGDGKAVAGDTHVIVGGNVNPNDGIDDSASNISSCYVYGGGEYAPVGGKTNVTLDGNAVVYFIVGTGRGAPATASNTNIFIKGGKVMNVYGGSADSEVVGCDTHITMTGGLAEALFGGCQSKPMTGNAYINLIGGDVSRRVYAGCYNNWSFSYKTKHYVTGTTTISIYPEMKLNTKTELSSGNADNMGVFPGSRLDKSTGASAEYNRLIYMNGCQVAQKGNIGDVSGWSWAFPVRTDCTISATAGGTVYGTSVPGEIIVEPELGMVASVGGVLYGKEAVMVGSSATVTFEEDFVFHTFEITQTDSQVTASACITGRNALNKKEPCIILALYDNDVLVKEEIVQLDGTMLTVTATTQKETEGEHRYYARTMVVTADMQPILEAREVEL